MRSRVCVVKYCNPLRKTALPSKMIWKVQIASRTYQDIESSSSKTVVILRLGSTTSDQTVKKISYKIMGRPTK